MTVQITRPTGRDPRFPKAQGAQAPGERVRAAAEARTLRCGRGPCGTAIPVAELSPDQRRRYADALGFVQGKNEKAHLLYCSKLCREQDETPTTPALCGCPTCRDPKSLAAGPKVCARSHPAPAGLKTCAIERVSVRDVTDRQGRVHRAIVCDRWACSEARYVDPAATPERIAQIAEASGYVQTAHGTTCGPDCAAHLARDVAAGRQDPLELSVEVVDAVRVAHGLAPESAEKTQAVETSAQPPKTAASPAPSPAPEAAEPSPPPPATTLSQRRRRAAQAGAR